MKKQSQSTCITTTIIPHRYLEHIEKSPAFIESLQSMSRLMIQNLEESAAIDIYSMPAITGATSHGEGPGNLELMMSISYVMTCDDVIMT